MERRQHPQTGGPLATTATGINDAGQVVGTSFFIGPYFATATDWIGGSAVYLQNLPGATESVAFGINDAGQVVGVEYSAAGTHGYATEWSGGSVINLANLPGIIASTAYDINDAGLVVGSSFIEGPCTLPSGAASSIIDLGGLPGYTPPAKQGALATSGR